MTSVHGQTILVTGATDGLGKRVALDLAEKEASVLVHGRDPERTEAAVREISETAGNDKVRYYLGNFSSLEEVRKVADEVRSEHDRLDVLINKSA